MSRIALANIHSITFYKDEWTLSRRGSPIPQLSCIGKPCRLYQPDAVRCVNVGGSGTDVDWKCEADLPDSMRFGKLEVSCEGWDGPGDPYVLKGSCGLEYRLVQIPAGLRGATAEDPRYPSLFTRWLHDFSQDPTAALFMFLWVVILGLLLYSMFSSCLRRMPQTTNRQTPRPWWGSGPSSGWFSGIQPDSHDSRPNGPPPPYSKHPPPSNTAPAAGTEGWRPGFWTGAALGGLSTYLFNRQTRPRVDPSLQSRTMQVPSSGIYDWEAQRMFRSMRPAPAASTWFGGGSSAARRRAWEDQDRGEGSSSLGPVRRSTGFGNSRVR